MTGPGHTEISTGDRQLCEERVIQSAPLFRVSRVFAQEQCVDQLLGLYALFASLEQLGWLSKDPMLVASNIQWWSQQIHGEIQGQAEGAHQLDDPPPGRHPVLRLLTQSGAMKRLPAKSLDDLIELVACAHDIVPPADMDELRQLCQRLHQGRLMLELALGDSQSQYQELMAAMAAIGGLSQLLRLLIFRPEAGGWWLPMDLLAQHQRSRAEASTDPHFRNQLVRDLVRQAATWCRPRDFRLNCALHDDLRDHRHLYTYHYLLARQLASLARKPVRAYTTAMTRLRPNDFIAAWWFARGLPSARE